MTLRAGRVAAVWVGLLWVAPPGAAAQAPPAAPHGGTPAVLRLVVNGQAHADVLTVLAGDVVWAPAEALRAAGLVWREARVRTDAHGDLIDLGSVRPALVVRIDDIEARLIIDAPPQAFAAQVGSGRVRTVAARPRNPSAFLNYSGTVLGGGGRSFASEVGIRTGGVLLRSTLSRARGGALVRGGTTLTFDDERRLVRWEAGDTVAAGGFGGASTPIAGVTVARQFGIDPQFLRLEPQTVSGATTVPAVAEVYVNGQLVTRQTIAPGTFELRDIEVPIGAGDVQLVLRDDFGRVHQATSSFYRSPQVLRRGVHAFRYSAGLAREDILGSIARYGDVLVSAEHRVGLTRAVTVGGSAQVSGRTASSGVSFATQIRPGEFEVGFWLSRSDGRVGAAWSAAYAYRGRRFSVGASARRTTADFDEHRGPHGAGPRRLEADLSASVRVARRVSVTGRYAAVEDPVGRRAERGTVSTSFGLGAGTSLSVGVIAGRPSGDPRFGYGAQSTLHVALGQATSASAGVFRSTDGTSQSGAAVQRSLPLGPGVGYRVQLTDGGVAPAGAVLEWQGRPARVELRGDAGPGGVDSAVTVSGAVALVGGAVHLSRPIHDAFALVRVPGVPGVRTYLSNQFVGRTNARGEVLVPSLASYFANRLAVDDRDVPFEYDITQTASVVAPAFRAGGIVSFPVRVNRLVSGRFAVADGGESEATVNPLAGAAADVRWPAGLERARLDGSGAFFFERAEPGRHEVRLTGEGRQFRCTLAIGASPDDPLAIEDLGRVVCVAAPADGGGR